MSLRLLWPTRSRSGSQFILKLTRSLYGSKLGKVALINGARRDTTANEDTVGSFKEFMADGKGAEYIDANSIGALKYEDPGKDDFVLSIMDSYPEARAVASYRRIEDIIVSHYNINRWGHGEPDVLYQFSASLAMYQELFSRGQLYLVNVDSPETFSLKDLTRFLGVDETRAAREIVAGWEPSNTLAYQQEKHDGGVHGKSTPPRIERLRKIHPWVDEVEQGYLKICNRVPGSIAADQEE